MKIMKQLDARGQSRRGAGFSSSGTGTSIFPRLVNRIENGHVTRSTSTRCCSYLNQIAGGEPMYDGRNVIERKAIFRGKRMRRLMPVL